MSQLRFDDKVVVVTGAGGGIGKQYALFFGSRGAKVVVNDLGGSVKGQGASSSYADEVVNEIKSKGGKAVANYDSVEHGDKIIKTAVDTFGKVDILINNAGILRDIAFQNMSEEDWNLVLKVHLQGTFSVCRAAWNIMRNQNYGRIINTASGSGLYGSFGQANYSAAKLGIHGLTVTLAKEGEKRNIRVNTIAPVAATRMTETVMNKEMLTYLSPEFIVPLVGFLAHDTCNETGSCFELGGGFISKVRFQRSAGTLFDLPFTPEEVRDKFDQICDYSKENDYPTSNSDAFPKIMENVEKQKARPKPTPTPTPTSTSQTSSTTTSSTPSTGSTSSLKSDKIFAMMNNYLSKGEGKEQVAKLQAIYVFEISPKKGAPVAKTFVIDLKNGSGKVYEGKTQADATFTMTDDDFESVCLGTLNPQNAFMQGKMKIKGNMKKATMFTPELFPPPTPENMSKFGGSTSSGTCPNASSSSTSSGTCPNASSSSTSTSTSTSTTTSPSSGSTTGTSSSTSSSSLKSDKIFTLMNTYLSQGEGKEQVAKLQAIYLFEISPKKGAPVAKTFVIDLKNGNGKVYEGKTQADATFTMTDDDFEEVCLGKLNPQNAFMQGKMKIKGNMKKATMFTPELFPAPTPENLAKYLSGSSTTTTTSSSSTTTPSTTSTSTTSTTSTPSASTGSTPLKTQRVFDMMGQYLEKGDGGAAIVKKIDAVYAFEILTKKGGPIAKKFIIDLKNGNGKVYEGTASQVDATFTITDDDFESLCNGTLSGQNAFMQGKMKIKGNMKKATMFTPALFPSPSAENVAKLQNSKL